MNDSSVPAGGLDAACVSNRVGDRCRELWRRHPWPLLGIALLTLVVYAPVIRFGFLNWDDSWYIVRNDLIKSWHPANLYGIATENVARNFAPLTIFTFLVEHTLWGLRPGGYHATNVVIHLVNGWLVYLLIRRFTGNDVAAWMTAALFALHPVQVESVAWISSRKTVLSSTFMLASFLCWLKPERSARDEGWGNLWLILALLCKASAVVIPPIVVAYDVLIARKKPVDAMVRQAIPAFLCVMSILVTMGAQTSIVGGVRSHIGNGKLWVIAIDSTLLWRYVAMLVYPVNLCVLYDPPTEGIVGVIALSLLSWGGLTAWAWRLRERHPWPAFALACWYWLLFPMLNFFPITTLMNDRYLYLPCVPLFALAVAGVRQLTLGWRPALRQTAGVMVGTLILGAMTWQTLGYLPVWKEPLTLWSHARERTPSLTVVQFQWALTLEELGHDSHAADALQVALVTTNPDEVDQRRIHEMLARLEGGGSP